MVKPTNGTMEDGDIELGFEMKLVTLSVDEILPVKMVTPDIRRRRSYKRLKDSIAAGGLVQPLVVFRNEQLNGKYELLNGHQCLDILKAQGEKDVQCLVAKDREAYTYNKMVNNPPPIELHKMIKAALKSGATEQELAERLSMDVGNVIKKRDMLDGVCDGAISLLDGKNVAFDVYKALRKMKSGRQIDAIQMMENMNDYTAGYANLLLNTTPEKELVKPRPKPRKHLTPEGMDQLQKEMASIEEEYKTLSEDDGFETIKHTFAMGYLQKLLKNKFVNKYLKTHHYETFEVFKKITQTTLHSIQDIDEQAEAGAEIVDIGKV